MNYNFRADDPLLTSTIKILGAVVTALIATVTLERIRKKSEESAVAGDPILREFSRMGDSFYSKKI